MLSRGVVFGIGVLAASVAGCGEDGGEVVSEADQTSALDLKTALDREATAFGVNVAFAVRDLVDDEHVERHGDRPQKAASSIKLFTLAGAIAQIARGDGALGSFDEVAGGYDLTLRASNNEATDIVLRALGGGDPSRGIRYTNDHLARLGVDPGRMRFVSWVNGAVEPRPIAPAPGNLAERFNRMAPNEVTKALAGIYRGAEFANDPIPGSNGKGAIDFFLDTVAERGISFADKTFPSVPRVRFSEKIGVLGPDEANLQATNSIGIVRLEGCSGAPGGVAAYAFAMMVQASFERQFAHGEAVALLGRMAKTTIGYMNAKHRCGIGGFPSPSGGGAGGGGGGGGLACQSATLGVDVSAGTCVQRQDGARAWFRCEGGGAQDWTEVAGPDADGCASCPQLGGSCGGVHGSCDSATLGTAVPAGTCVQRADRGQAWFRCGGADRQDWTQIGGPDDAGCSSCPQLGGRCP